METITTIKQLWAQVPILSTKRIADMTTCSRLELKEIVIKNCIASPDEWRYRSKFVSYCLESDWRVKCKFCGLVLDLPGEEHVDYSGFCFECVDRFNPPIYNTGISWYRNMMLEEWFPLNNGWRNLSTGTFLPKRYMPFFIRNEITP